VRDLAGRAVVIIGSSSAIARALADRFAAAGCRVILAGRDQEDIERTATDLRVRRRAWAQFVHFDAENFDSHRAFINECAGLFGGPIDGVVLAQGYMPEQAAAETNPHLAVRAVHVNFAACVTVIGAALAKMPEQGGFIAAISSVAGDRGRPSNFVYGSTKAGLNTYLAGLRAKVRSRGISVTCVKPGFVDTAMTWGLPGLFLVASPRAVADDVVRAVRRGRSEIYTPWFWRWIMLIIRCIPGPVFNRMKL